MKGKIHIVSVKPVACMVFFQKFIHGCFAFFLYYGTYMRNLYMD